jgi:hypothetical protein
VFRSNVRNRTNVDLTEECLRLAADASTPDAKEHFQTLAQRGLALAVDEEASADLLEEWGDPV